MKILVVSLCILIANFSIASANDLTPHRDLAIAIIKRAITNSESANIINRLTLMKNTLERTKIYIPPEGADFQICDRGDLAYTLPRIPNTIFVCRSLLTKSLSAIAQTFIHESAHLSGYGDECKATMMEVYSMVFSGKGLAFRNAYMDSCNL